jgi:hypothetical protein
VLQSTEDAIKNGEPVTGLKINHTPILDTDELCEVLDNVNVDELVNTCSKLDLRLIYYRLTTHDAGAKTAKQIAEYIVFYISNHWRTLGMRGRHSRRHHRESLKRREDEANSNRARRNRTESEEIRDKLMEIGLGFSDSNNKMALAELYEILVLCEEVESGKRSEHLTGEVSEVMRNNLASVAKVLNKISEVAKNSTNKMNLF